MATSLKISNVFENKEELLARLRGIKSPGKNILIKALKTDDWETIYKELLYRIELYTTLKVLNYTRKDVNTIAVSLKLNKNIELVVAELVGRLPIESLMESCNIDEDEDMFEFDDNDVFKTNEGWEAEFDGANM